MSLEDERARGELNVKGDKGIKNTFSTREVPITQKDINIVGFTL